MKNDNRRFLIILGCTALVAVLLFEMPPVIMNFIDQTRLDRVEIGMSREKAIEIMHRKPTAIANGTEVINVSPHRSWLRELFAASATREEWEIVIQTGQVARVDLILKMDIY